MDLTHSLTCSEAQETSIPAKWDRATTPGPEAQLRLPALQGILPSLGDFAWLMPLLFLFGRMNGAPGLLGDGDTGWHIRTGEWILAHGRVPYVDTFSFTKAGEPWFAWEWLSEVLMGALHQAGGMQAVLLGAMLLICSTFFLLYRLIRRASGSVLIAFTLTTLAAGGSAIHWLARPHLFTMLFVVVFCSILERRQMKLLWVLPLLTVLWTNLHGGFIAGILLTGAWAGGEGLGVLASRTGEHRTAALRRCGYYTLATAGCIAASFVNPYGWRLHRHVATYLTNPAYFETIAEFLSISFRHPLAPFFEVMLMLGLATTFWNLTRGRFIPVLLLMGWGHLALLSVRNIPLFLLVAAPQVGFALSEWLGLLGPATEGTALRWLHRGVESAALRLKKADEGPHWYVAGPCCLFLLGRAMYSADPAPPLRASYDPRNYPAAAVSLLRPSDRVFTSDTWGGYLIYSRYPAPVFIDGRSDFYGPAFERLYNDVMTARYNWQAVLTEHRIDTVLLPVSAPLSTVLKTSAAWHPVHDDGHSILFRAGAEPVDK